uniref:Reverse transcriptase domain-containing protein n=1 Tax=Panagrellus redivivus TaxID=6233 RepID=A0A7E4WCD2_PANRE
VINCSSKTSKNDRSLNDCVHQGPDLLPQLLGILIRSRPRQYLMSGDVEKAFHQIVLDPNDRDYVRIIWLRDITKPCDDDNLVVYRFARVLFGLKTSPFLLSAVLRYHFMSSPGNEAVILNTYVDNVFVFTDDKEFAVHEKFRLKDLLKDACMNLRCFFSNDFEIDSVFDDSEKYTGEVTKILGIEYDKVSDCFVFNIEIADTGLVWTPARIIKAQLQVFDPLGLLLPTFVPIKAFLHKLTKLKVPLKKPLSPHHDAEWREILRSYTVPCRISIRRYAGRAESYELHVFSDASSSFVAACAYLRVKHPDGSFTVTLLMARSKVKDDLIRDVDD